MKEELTVQNEHHSGEVKGPLLVPEDHLTKIADITNLGVAQAELPGHRLDDEPTVADQKAYQVIKDVYKTKAAMTTVKIRPGTRPRTEYDHGNDMMAKQMYSENSRAAVWSIDQYCHSKRKHGPVKACHLSHGETMLRENETYFGPAASAVLDGILGLQLDLLANGDAVVVGNVAARRVLDPPQTSFGIVGFLRPGYLLIVAVGLGLGNLLGTKS